MSFVHVDTHAALIASAFMMWSPVPALELPPVAQFNSGALPLDSHVLPPVLLPALRPATQGVQSVFELAARQLAEAMGGSHVNGAVHEALNSLRDLKDDWDNEGAPAPSAAAVDLASLIVEQTSGLKGVQVADIDADVLGGVAVWLCSTSHPARRVWISCMNRGKHSVVCMDGATVHTHAALSPESFERASFFLAGRPDGEAGS